MRKVREACVGLLHVQDIRVGVHGLDPVRRPPVERLEEVLGLVELPQVVVRSRGLGQNVLGLGKEVLQPRVLLQPPLVLVPVLQADRRREEV